MTSSEFELVTQVVNNGERHWAPLKSGLIATRGEFPEEMHVSLSSRTLAATQDDEPQIIFFAGRELSRFTLSLESLDKKQRFHVTSQGSVPWWWKTMTKRKTKEQGMTLLEVMVALVIFSTAALALMNSVTL